MGESTSGIVRTRSEQLETVSGVKSLSRTASAEAITIQEINSSSGQSLSGKQGFGKKPTGTSPGRKGANHHTRKSRGSQKLELEEFNSGAALSRASSASLGFSFSFTGFTAPPELQVRLAPGRFWLSWGLQEVGRRHSSACSVEGFMETSLKG